MPNRQFIYPTVIFLSVISTTALRQAFKTEYFGCDIHDFLDDCEYEAGECGWFFASPQLLYAQKPLDNFQVVQPTDSSSTRYAYAKMVPSRRQPAMLISPYYQYLSNQCNNDYCC
uniref:MAM domain-containing protein n=1 Tax=Syphacia muris TaxID=451379 RepID=A0A0N5AH47_9BILA